MRRRWLSGFLIAALVAAACSSTDDDSRASDDTSQQTSESTATTGSTASVADADQDPVPEPMPPGIQVGITDDSIKLAMIYVDTAPLVETGLVADFGDVEQSFQTFVDRQNENGGIGGRTVSASYHPVPAGTDLATERAACLAATEDEEPFVVISPGGIKTETILCVAEEHETLVLTFTGANTDEEFERAGGRYFNNAIGVSRLLAAGIDSYVELGLLDGATIGLVRTNAQDDDNAQDALESALAEQGLELAEVATLVCEGLACSLQENAAELLRSTGVDALFTFLGPTENPSFVEAAGAVGYTPRYFASDYNSGAFNSTARFLQNGAEFYDGAIAITSAVKETEPDAYRQACNDDFTDLTGVQYEPLTEAWLYVGNSCEVMDRITRVVEAIEAAGLEVGQDTFIEYMEHETVDNGARHGSFGQGKHDAYDTVEVREFKADCHPPDENGITVCWEQIEGTERVLSG